MEKQTKNLGHVTAYGYAVSQGYTGTEEEYAELMASYATVAERAETAAQEAEESAQEVKDVIPEVTAQDNGKVMMVENGEWGAGEVDVLPTVTSQDNGKVLGVVEGQWAKTEPEDGLPEVTSSDNGKVLSVVEGAWAPAEPTGGSGLPEVTSEDNGDLLTVVDGAWAKSEPGYRVETVEGTEIAPEQSVTTAAGQVPLEIAGEITYNEWPSPVPSSLSVSFNGTEYTVPLYYSGEGINLYGEFDAETGTCLFTTYPCGIEFFEQTGKLALITEAAGTFTVSVSEPETRDVVPTEDFKLAVNNSYMETTETEKEVIPEQSVTTAVQGSASYAIGRATDFTFPADFYSQELWPTTLHVTFNGTEYDLPQLEFYGEYGAPAVYDPEAGSDVIDVSTYPCSISFSEQDGVKYCYLYTEVSGTYTIEATYTEATTAPTEKFKEAVKQSGGGAMIVNDDNGYLDKTWQEIFDAYISGTAVVIRQETFLDNGGDGDELTADYYPLQRLSADTITTQGEETVTYYVYAVDDRYETSSADGYPYINSGGGGGES